MDSETIKPEVLDKSNPSNETKLQVISQLLPELAVDSRLMISGSMSQKIAEKIKDGIYTLEPEDLTTINDLDIASTKGNTVDLEAKCKPLAQTGFKAEVGLLFFNSAYPDSPVKELTSAPVEIVLPDGQRLTVSYTTPEFLLLTLADQIVSKATPKEKYQKKVQSIQKLPGFSDENFRKLVKYELQTRHALNKGTFEIWKRNILKETDDNTFMDTFRRDYKKVHSIVDETQICNIVRSKADLVNLQFTEVRSIPILEKFVREMDEPQEDFTTE